MTYNGSLPCSLAAHDSPIMVTTSQPWNLSQVLAIELRYDFFAFERSLRTRADSLICIWVSKCQGEL
jgi:hypothetical protein